MPIPVSCCENCRHRHFSNLVTDEARGVASSCVAYPDGIPFRIWTDKFSFVPKWVDGIPMPDLEMQAPEEALCFGIEGINYLPMREDDWEKQMGGGI